MTIQQYIDNLNQRYKLGNATEHTFRGDLQQLLESLVPDIRATNEPKRQACGAPDYIITKKDIPIGFIEAKDIGDKDLEGLKKTGNKEQFDRYKASLNNLFFTDYLDFHLYIDGQFVTKIAIAEITDKGIMALPQNFATFTNLIKDFCSHTGQTIKSSKKLAEMMAGKARLLSDVIEKSLTSDEIKNENSTLKDQMTAFREILIHDITPKGFADVYAQTICYGMFAARLHDPTLPTFSRQEAAELIPKSNPFLRKLFGYIAGPDIDDRIKWIVDSLVEIFLACNVEEILKNYGKTTKMEDPIIHFYENFLSEYDPALRKARGVWYTPAPVVNFIVRAVDDILKTEFNLPQGLADSSKTKIKINNYGLKPVEQEVHKVQILDPATGTGTFLAEVVKHIHKKFEGQKGIWSDYVETNLLPRLNGFELLMASYAMAHLQLDLLLTETGYKPTNNQRFRVYLTNSLEESHPDTGTLFASWLSAEANEANHIKRDAPVMCVIGNPPYSGESQNKGEWMMRLMEDYKKEPSGKEKLKEKNPKWINDDYVKFLRYGQYYIEKNGSGVLAFINPHGFLDNPTFRGMRWNLLKTYDKIYTIDLHGNSKKKETAPDGSPDENVFDIMQGVSINIFVKTGNKKNYELGKVFHYDLFGKRELKYDFLNTKSLSTVGYKELPNIAPDYYFVNKDFDQQENYGKGFSVNELFTLNSVGIVTARDEFTIHNSKQDVEKIITEFLSLDNEKARTKFNLGQDVRDWQVNLAKKDLQSHFPNKGTFTKISYRPFDTKWTFYTGKSKGFHCYPRNEVMQHFSKGENIGLVSIRRSRSKNNWQEIFVSTNMIAGATTISALDINYLFPLYLYPETKDATELLEGRKSMEAKLEEGKMFAENFEKTFRKVKKMYDALPNPTEDIKKYYAEQVKQLQKLEAKVELFKQQLASDYSQTLFQEEKRKPNLNTEIVKQIAQNLGLAFTAEKDTSASSVSLNTFAPIDLLDYIYAVLHSPTYREKYKEFLKIDFPRVPYPKDKDTFWQLVKLGGEIRQIHLLESPIVEQYITQYPVDGDNVVTKIKYQEVNSPALKGRVYINDTQYFENVPQIAWDFYIGGYQPAQKWLKDRKDRTLEFDDILHYQKIIVALTETNRLMSEINKIDIE
jgi:predicted helicase